MRHGGLITIISFAAAWSVCFGANPPAAHLITKVHSQRFDVHYDVPPEAMPLTAVELWYTYDQGVTWSRFGFDADLTSPVTFDAPNEGLCGLYVIITNPAGASGDPPRADTQPHQWVYIDYQQPVCQFHPPVVTKTAGGTNLQLQWSVIDANLPSRPIRIDYRPAGEVEWRLLAADLPNTGRYDWVLPANLRGDVDFQITASDRGGHQVRCDSTLIQYDPPTAKRDTVPVAPVQATRSDAQRSDDLLDGGLRTSEQPSVKSTSDVQSAPKTGDMPMILMEQLSQAPAQPPVIAATQSDEVTHRDQMRALELLNRARRHARDGGWELAATAFADAARIDPTLNEALVELGESLYALDRYADAVDAYDRVLKRTPGSRAALLGSARSLVKLHRFLDAQERLQRIVRSDPQDASTWLYLGDVAIYRGDAVMARQYYTKAATMAHADIDTVERANQRLGMLPSLASQYARMESRQ